MRAVDTNVLARYHLLATRAKTFFPHGADCAACNLVHPSGGSSGVAA